VVGSAWSDGNGEVGAVSGRTAIGTCALVAGVLLVGGCATTVRGVASPVSASASSSSAEPTPAETGSPTSSSAPDADVNERGNVEKQIGEEAGITGPDGSPAMTFTVDAIQIDLPCSGDYPEPPENGHFVGLTMHVTTAPNLAPDSYIDISAGDFSFIGADGITVGSVDTFPAFICAADDEQLPTGPLGSGQQYVGTLVLDVPGTTGILQYQPLYLDSGGWEWSF
jgi:hypothetical protein